MKNTLYLSFIASILLFTGCSQKQEISLNESSYFVGSWALGNGVVTESNPFVVVFTFEKQGTLELNIKFSDTFDPIRRWSYDNQTSELKLLLPQQESYIIIERTSDRFKAQNKETNAVLIFSRQ